MGASTVAGQQARGTVRSLRFHRLDEVDEGAERDGQVLSSGIVPA